jgi:8-oxo-dGTP diphosphatase
LRGFRPQGDRLRLPFNPYRVTGDYMIKAERNIYDGMMIDPDSLPTQDNALLSELKTSLAQWHSYGAALAWLTLSSERNALVPAVMNLGFQYHNCTAEYLTLVKKLNPKAFVPSFATHYIGAGGVVINDKNQLLVISEKAHVTKHYKLPGGLLEQGEDLVKGVEREVLEETGIRAVFDSVVCMRHTHGYQFGKSDIYFVCRLKPLSEKITPEPGEISEARWMDIQEYLNGEKTHIFNKTIVEAALSGQKLLLSDKIDYSFRHKKIEVFLPEEIS